MLYRMRMVSKVVSLEEANGTYYNKKGYLFTRGWETSMAKCELLDRGWEPVENNTGNSIFLKDRAIIYVMRVEEGVDYERY